MVITYQKNYRELTKGYDWVLYSDVKLKDTLIIHHLLEVVNSNRRLPFDELYETLKEANQNKKVKSFCQLSKEGGRIEALVKGVFPRFYIEKTDKYIYE